MRSMKICLIRHAKVNMNWPRICNSVEFDNACKDYDLADIFKVINQIPIFMYMEMKR